MRKYTKEILEPIARESNSVSEMLRKLGSNSYSGSTSALIKARLAEFGISTDHFVGGSWSAGRPSPNRRSLEEILTFDDRKRRSTEQLRRALLGSGVQEECSICGIGPCWNGKSLTLQIDHINGTWADNSLGNLRFLCPNCHSQTPTYSKSKSVVNVTCKTCGKPVRKRSTYCIKCIPRGVNRSSSVNWPTLSELREMVSELGYRGTGRHLGVTDNAVRKRLERE
jgi:hypothetical protein